MPSEREWDTNGDLLRISVGVTYARLGERLPGLSSTTRPVGWPQIRMRGTVGGNLGTVFPAGDADVSFGGPRQAEIGVEFGTGNFTSSPTFTSSTSPRKPAGG